MARVSNWKPEQFNGELVNASMGRLRMAAHYLAGHVRAKCPIGTISRPIYKTGPYAGVRWTGRDAGALRKTVRVVELNEDKHGALIATFYGGKNRNIRVYAGNFLVYYAKIVEFIKPFMRPAINAAKAGIRRILENG